MRIFGTNQPEEAELREAAAQNTNNDHRGSAYSLTGSSGYDTADDDFGSEVFEATSNGQNLETPKSNNRGSSVPEPDQEYVGSTIANRSNDDHVDNESITRSEVVGDSNSSTENDPSHVSAYNDELKIDSNGSEFGSGSKEKICTLADLDWDDEFDKDDPYNWANWKKWYCTFVTASICLCVSIGSSLFVTGVPDLAPKVGASRELCVSGLTFYMVGLAFGPAIGAPISETFGRSVVYLSGFPASMLFTMGVGLSDKIYQILILRFFCGLLASPALAIAGGTINDIWKIEERGFAMATFCLAAFLGPVLGPVIGGFVTENKGWKWTMWVFLMFCGAVLPFVLLLPETYKPIILVRRAKKRDYKLHLPPKSAILKQTIFITLLRPVEMLVTDPIVSLWSFYISFVFAVLFGFFEAFPIIFQGEYHMTLGISGLTFIGVGVGLVLGVVFFIFFDRYAMFPTNPDGTKGRRDENGNPTGKPEQLLIVGKLGGICMPISLFWLAWTGRSDIHWMCPTVSGVPFGFGLILIFFTNMLYFVVSFPPASVASAIGANNLMRYTLASVFPLFTTQMYEKLHIDWATSLLAFISLALLPIPWFFEIYGERLRKNSKFGYAALIKEQEEKEAKRKERELHETEEEQEAEEEKAREELALEQTMSRLSEGLVIV